MPNLSLRFLGTGNAFSTDGRGAQCLWIEIDGGIRFLVDVGPTAVAAMAQYQLDPDELEGCLFTHLHGDHIAGWPFLLLHYRYISARRRPFRIVGPTGTEQRLATLAQCCYEDSLRQQDLSFAVEAVEVPVELAESVKTGLPIGVDVVPMEHAPESVGYRLRVGDHTIGISGDTRWCDGLETLARGCDLLVLECTFLEQSPSAHVSLAELRSGRTRLQAEQIVLVHHDDSLAEALAKDPIPDVFIAEDGMVVEM